LQINELISLKKSKESSGLLVPVPQIGNFTAEGAEKKRRETQRESDQKKSHSIDKESAGRRFLNAQVFSICSL
jgi:hypothetical protein